jgi:hypothetical protein
MDLSKMSSEELEAHYQELDGQRAAIQAEARLVRAEIDQRVAAAEAARKLASMSDREKAALIQMLEAQGIESAEGFGSPGA